jgi:CIC family chloride channel protein
MISMSKTQRLVRRAAQGLQLSENGILLALAVLVGLSTGAGVWVFRVAIEFFQELIREEFVHEVLPFGDWGIVLALALVGLTVGLLMQTFVGHQRHHGVAGVIESVALAGGRMRYKKVPFKSVAAALSLGGGASVGPEDPSVQIGANIGSFFGQFLHLTEERIRLLVAAGAASAIAAAFNAPIAGVFFALEVVLGNFATGSVGVVVLSAVMASVFTHAVEHGGPELGIRAYQLGGPAQVPFYILLGIVVAPFAIAFIRMVYWQHDLWHHWSIPVPIKTALAGVMVGVVGVFLPDILGTGREPMNEVLNSGGGDFTIWLLAALVVAKIIMTSVSMAGGFQGGIFAPSLFAGAMLGGAFGRVAEEVFPQLNIGDPAAYAIAGMAAMMAGVVRAPITAILLIFELTNNYELILPIMLATVVTVFLTDRFESDGIYSKALRRVGLHIQHGRDVDVMQSVLVREVMQTPPPNCATPCANITPRRCV